MDDAAVARQLQARAINNDIACWLTLKFLTWYEILGVYVRNTENIGQSMYESAS